MILIDTNVISETMRRQPNAAVTTWLDRQVWGSLFLCMPVLAELHHGIERLSAGRQRQDLAHALDRIQNDLYYGRILSFDEPAAARYGQLTARREQQGRRMGEMDALIAAIAMTHRATIATRDMHDFDELGIELINPFDPR